MKMIYGDFMKNDDQNRLVLTRGSYRDLSKYNIEPVDGLRLVFYNEDEDKHGVRDDLVVAGVLEFDVGNERWAALIDWDDIKNISQLSVQEKHNLGID